MTVEQLATVLYYVWGAHGYARPANDVIALAKTSPSGGALHPIETYPVISGVEGAPSGIYHYNVAEHRLDLISGISTDSARALATSLLVGQDYFGNAHVTFLLTARFGRSYGKYRNQARAYSVIMMDAGHLAQSLYLVCGSLGLGAYVTAAINGANIDELLGTNWISEGAIAACGCGVAGGAEGDPPARRRALKPEFASYVPRMSLREELRRYARTHEER
jgi:SagB-type dehydrogenase family enzyme